MPADLAQQKTSGSNLAVQKSEGKKSENNDFKIWLADVGGSFIKSKLSNYVVIVAVLSLIYFYSKVCIRKKIISKLEKEAGRLLGCFSKI